MKSPRKARKWRYWACDFGPRVGIAQYPFGRPLIFLTRYGALAHIGGQGCAKPMEVEVREIRRASKKGASRK